MTRATVGEEEAKRIRDMVRLGRMLMYSSLSGLVKEDGSKLIGHGGCVG